MGTLFSNCFPLLIASSIVQLALISKWHFYYIRGCHCMSDTTLTSESCQQVQMRCGLLLSQDLSKSVGLQCSATSPGQGMALTQHGTTTTLLHRDHKGWEAAWVGSRLWKSVPGETRVFHISALAAFGKSFFFIFSTPFFYSSCILSQSQREKTQLPFSFPSDSLLQGLENLVILRCCSYQEASVSQTETRQLFPRWQQQQESD